jgi:hypothetical protein
MVCPYNDFKECFKEECPFYYKSTSIVNGHYAEYEYCERAEREKRRT